MGLPHPPGSPIALPGCRAVRAPPVRLISRASTCVGSTAAGATWAC